MADKKQAVEKAELRSPGFGDDTSGRRPAVPVGGKGSRQHFWISSNGYLCLTAEEARGISPEPTR